MAAKREATRIVVLDGHTLNPGDLSWSPLEALGECTVYERTPPGLVAARAAGAGVALTNKVVFDEAVLAQLPDLRYIGVLATGYNVVDIPAARWRGIVVTNVPAYATPSVVQATMALLMELTLNVGHHSRTVREGRWAASADFCYWDRPLVEVAGLTMGLVGLGTIGGAVAGAAQAMGMRVLGFNRSPASVPGVENVGLEELFRRADVVSLHCPLNDGNRRFVNAALLGRMKPTALLINTARGGLIDEEALADALNAGRIAGAGLDVLSSEPPAADNPLLSARNCVITPHVAWATTAARQRLLTTAIENVRAFLAGRPTNVVSG